MSRALFAISSAVALCLAASASAQSTATAELVAELPESVGNITFTPDKRLIFSHHPFYGPKVRVAEMNADRKSFRPFPNEEWNTPRPGTDQYLDSVLGLRGDERGVIWMLDMGLRTPLTPKVVGWNTKTNKLERVYYIPAPASRPESQHNDLVVDNKNNAIYIADEGIGPGGDGTKAALVVVDMKTGLARRVLEGHVSTLPESVPITVDGRPLLVPGKDKKPVPILVGADGIAADQKFEWLYYGPLNGQWIYRVRIKDLLNTGLSDAKLGESVERYAKKPNNGGLSIDRAGNLYLTEVESKAVGIIPAADKTYRRFVSDPKMIWPDGLSYSPDGYMYVSAAQISEVALFNGGEARNRAPYYIFRFKPVQPGRIGH